MNSYFPDINVWIALAYGVHEHHAAAMAWLSQVEGEELYFCRFTQMGFLRLLTHPSVMREDVKSQQQAWQAYDWLMEDERIRFLSEPEPDNLEATFRTFTSGSRSLYRQWSDAYLAAFAQSESLTLVTFDRALHRISDDSLLLA